MIKYRRWLDDNIIYLGLLNGAYDYKFRKEDKNDFNDDAKDEIEPMRQFQSMLFVSSDEWQEWVLKAYRKCQNKPLRLEILKELDAHNEEHSLPELGDTLSLSYGSINRYWFWFLDYILWEKIREQIKKQKKEETSSNTEIELGNVHLKLSNDQKDSIINYKFRRNRSIEHLHPQSDEHLTNVEKWNQVLLEDTTIKYPKDWFGNLAMISSNFNSGQGNESIGVKFARLKDTQIPQKSLESIKMLLMFLIAGGNENEWTPDESIKHGKAMYELLKSYCDSISDTEK